MKEVKLTLDEICQLEVMLVNAIEETDLEENKKAYKKLQRKLNRLKKSCNE